MFINEGMDQENVVYYSTLKKENSVIHSNMEGIGEHYEELFNIEFQKAVKLMQL